MKKLIALFSIALLMGCSMKPTHVLLVTGGHDFDKPAFFAMMDALENITYETAEHPNAISLLVPENVHKYDAILFYDGVQEISEPDKKILTQMVENGKGIVFLHHALICYDGWPEITQIRGGRYVMAPDTLGDYIVSTSTYKHDLELDVKIVDPQHPITRGMSDFQVRDEGYNQCQVFDSVTPLLTTEHPDCEKTVAWTHKYKNSPVVYLMLGHGPEAFANENFRTILGNAIRFVAKQ